MKVTKLVVSTSFLLAFAFGAFAQNAAYTDLVKKAKDAETKKQYAYAMGYYLDAVNADPANSGEAYAAYENLANEIKEGNPGYGKFTQFSLHSGWTDLLKDAEKYFTEYCPYAITVGKLEMGELDYTNKTATVSSTVSVNYSQKFYHIMVPICWGYTKVHRDDWKDLPAAPFSKSTVTDNYYSNEHYNAYLQGKEYSDSNSSYINSVFGNSSYNFWPRISVTKTAGAKKQDIQHKDSWYRGSDGDPTCGRAWGYSTTKTSAYPLPAKKGAYNSGNVATYATSYFAEDSNYNKKLKKSVYSWTDKAIDEYYNAFMFKPRPSDTFILYDLKVKIAPKTGKDFTKSVRFMPVVQKYYSSSNNDKIIFKGLTEAQMNAIDEGKADLVVEGVYLQYGLQSAADALAYYYDNSKSMTGFKANLPELSIPLSKVVLIQPSKGLEDKLENALYIAKEAVELKKLAKTINEQFADSIVNIELQDMSLTYLKISDDDGIRIYNKVTDYSDYYKVSKVCNALSLENGYTLCYDKDGNKIDGTGFYLATRDEAKSFGLKADYHDDYYIVHAKKFSPEEQAARLEKATKDANELLASNAEKSALIKEVYPEQNASLLASLEESSKELQSAIAKKDVTEIASKTAALKKILLDSAYEESKNRKDYAVKNAADADKVLSDSQAKLDAYKEVLEFDDSYKVVFAQLESFKTKIDSKNVLAISDEKEEIEKIDWASLEKRHEEVKAQNKKLAAETKTLRDQKESALNAVKAKLVKDSKYASDAAAIEAKLSELKTLFANAKDSVVAGKKPEIEALDIAALEKNVDAEVKALKEQEAKENSLKIFKAMGISLDPYSGTVKTKKSTLNVEAYSVSVEKKSAAAKAGLKDGDLVVFSNPDASKVMLEIKKPKQTVELPTAQEYYNVIGSKKSGDSVIIYYMRKTDAFAATVTAQ
ncbi:hypothetical protein [Treponema zioleckii]|uniref:hypothetical protein n=1 Tax=Treponema zioleckii TaxID=331680 RepID=UPI00168BC264|nr:hypothetical protein [Treponema zioleckii]